MLVNHDIEWFAEWTRSTGWVCEMGFPRGRIIHTVDAEHSNRTRFVFDGNSDPVCFVQNLKPTPSGWEKHLELIDPSTISFEDLPALARTGVKKIQVGVQVFKPIEHSYGINPQRLAFCRSLEIWQRLSTAELKRGLMATESGARSIAGLLGSANSKANEGGIFKGTDGKWNLNNPTALHRNQHTKPFTPQAIAACKQRAIEMRRAAA